MSKFTLTAFADEIDAELHRQLDVLEQHQIKHIEMRAVNHKLLVSHTLSEAAEVKQHLDAGGFKLSAIGSPLGKIGINEPFGPHLDLFKHTLELAKVMEAPYIRMFSFYIPKGQNPADYRDQVLERWQLFIEAAKGSGIVLLHENEHGIYGDIPERCLDLAQSLSSDSFKLIFDFANFVQCQVQNYPYAYELLKDHIAYIHVKDALRTNGSVVPAGLGDGHIKEILSELMKDDYEGFLSLEPHLWDYSDFSKLGVDSPYYQSEQVAYKRFSLAVQALRKILNDIKG